MIRSAQRLVLAWLALTMLTVGTWAASTDRPLRAADPRLVAVGALTLAVVKIAVIGREFMELRTAPYVLRALFSAWLLGVTGTVAYLVVG